MWLLLFYVKLRLASTPEWCQKCAQPGPDPPRPVGSAVKWREKAFAHTDWMIDFIWSVCWAQAWLCWCVMSVSMVKNTGHARLWAVQGVKKREKSMCKDGGAREIWVQEFRGCGFMARMTRQIESIFAAEKKLLCCCTKPVFQLLLLWTTAANQDFWTLSTNWSCRLYVVCYSTNKDGESGSYVCPHWSWAAMQEANVYNELSMNTITVWRISIIICLFCANRWREKVGGFDFFSK